VRTHAVVAALVLLVASPEPLFARRPNVVLIMTDDQGWGDVRSHDNAAIDTPALDRLAAEGARFERFYVSPVCAPTRASLLTGRYSLRTGTHGVTRGRENMRAEETTIAEALGAAGYATGCFGKWHNGRHYPYHPNGQGFDEFLGFCAGHWNNYFDTTLERNGVESRVKGFITDVLADAAIEFIDEHRAAPFFCYVPFNAPHSPWQVPDRYHDKYAKRGLDAKAACAYAMCENIDDNIGRILAKLDALELTRDTIVLFLTDNGPNSNRFNGGMKGRKGSVHEGGVRVPLFVRWPGRIAPGTRVEPIAMHIDLLPTLLELCGVPELDDKARPLDGRSLVPLLRLDGKPLGAWPERTLFTHRSRGNGPSPSIGAARTDRWRAVRYGEKRGWELYDMIADPGQKRNVAKAHPDVVAGLAKAFDANFADVTRDGHEPLVVPIGHPERGHVTLPGHEARFEAAGGKAGGPGIGYVGRNGWANDWITNWTSTAAHAWWKLEVVRGGTYDIELSYACSEENVGAKIRVEVEGASGTRGVDATVSISHDPEPIPSPDRIPRGEVYEKEWAPLRVGRLRLEKGPATLRLRALAIPGTRAPDVKAVRLTAVASR